jgi:hypothetical protein
VVPSQLLEAVLVDLPPAETEVARRLHLGLSTWSQFVEDLIACDAAVPIAHGAPTPDDYRGMLAARSGLDAALDRLSPNGALRARVVAVLDKRYADVTEPDDAGLLLDARVVLPSERDTWWYQRIPRRGEVRRALEEAAKAWCRRVPPRHLP